MGHTYKTPIVFQFGFGYAWLANEVGDTIDTFTKMFKMHVVDCTIQKPK